MGRQAATGLGAHLRKEVDGPRRVIVPVDFVCREKLVGRRPARFEVVRPRGRTAAHAPGG